MSELKIAALNHAVAIATGNGVVAADIIVANANTFYNFLADGAEPTKPRKTRTTADAPAEQAAAPTTAATVAAQTAQSAPATPAAAAQPAASAPASAASAATSGGPTLQKVADAVIDLANTVSREAAVQILTKYGAQKVPQLKPADFVAVLADVATLKSGGSLAAGAGAGLM